MNAAGACCEPLAVSVVDGLRRTPTAAHVAYNQWGLVGGTGICWQVIVSAFRVDRVLHGWVVAHNGCRLTGERETDQHLVQSALAKLEIPTTACGNLNAYARRPLIWMQEWQGAMLAWLRANIKVGAAPSSGAAAPTEAAMLGDVVHPDDIAILVNSGLFVKLRAVLDGGVVSGSLSGLISGAVLSATERSVLYGLLTHKPTKVSTVVAALTGAAAEAVAKTDSAKWNKLIVDLKVRLRALCYQVLVQARGALSKAKFDRPHMNSVMELLVGLDQKIFGAELWRFSSEETIINAGGVITPAGKDWDAAIVNAMACLTEVYGEKIGAKGADFIVGYVDQYGRYCKDFRSYPDGREGILRDVPGTAIKHFFEDLGAERDTGQTQSKVLSSMLAETYLKSEFDFETRRYFASIAELQGARSRGETFQFTDPTQLRQVIAGTIDWSALAGSGKRRAPGGGPGAGISCDRCGGDHLTKNHDRRASPKKRKKPRGGLKGGGQGGGTGGGADDGADVSPFRRHDGDGRGGGGNVCYDWQAGRCSRASCKFAHGEGDGGSQRQVCWDFQNGDCSRGSRCKFAHELESIKRRGERAGAAGAPPQAPRLQIANGAAPGAVGKVSDQTQEVKRAYGKAMAGIHGLISKSAKPESCMFMCLGQQRCSCTSDACTAKSKRTVSHKTGDQLEFKQQVEMFQGAPDVREHFFAASSDASEWVCAAIHPSLLTAIKAMKG